MIEKECIKCHKIKDIHEFPIRKYPNGKMAHKGECKDCLSNRQKIYQLNNKSSLKKKHAQYYKNNKSKIKEKQDKWWNNNRDKMNRIRRNKRKRERELKSIHNLINTSEDTYKTWI